MEGGSSGNFYLQGISVGFWEEQDEWVKSLQALFQVQDV